MRVNPWAFGMVFMMIASYVLWNDAQLPVVFIGETNETHARVIETKIVPGFKGWGYKENFKYVYMVDSVLYKSFVKVGTDLSKSIGNRLTIRYSVDNPSKHEIITFQIDYNAQNSTKNTFIRNKEVGYEEFILENGLFFYNDYLKRGKKRLECFGEFDTIQDTVILKPFIERQNRFVFSTKYLKTIDSLNSEVLIDLSTQKTFKKL